MASSSSSSVFLPRKIQSWIAILVPPAASLFFAMVSGHGVMSISITSLALVISTAILALKNPKPISSKNQNQGEISSRSSSEIKKVAVAAEEEEQQQTSAAAVSEDVDGKGQTQSLYSDDPSSSSEDYSDIDSTTHCCSDDDGSISDDDDEESLFEISLLPYSCHFVGHEKENSKDLCLQQQHCFVEFLTDMTEEDNMIEIDISMGSIKCSSGFEVEA